MEKDPIRGKSIAEVIDFALQREREAQEVYFKYAAGTKRVGFRQLLLSMAEMEKDHEKKLCQLREAAELSLAFPGCGGTDLRLGDYLVDVPFSADMEYGDFLILIVKKEEKSENLYRKLFALSEDRAVKELFSALAEEEKKHRRWAQDRYDLEILKDN